MPHKFLCGVGPFTLSPPNRVEFESGCNNKSILVLEYPALLSHLPPELPSAPQPQPPTRCECTLHSHASKAEISDNRVGDAVMIRRGILYSWYERSMCSALGRCRRDIVSTIKGIFFLYLSSLCLFFCHKGLA